MGGDDRDERVGRDGRSVDEKLAPHDFVADFVWAAREVLRKPSVAIVSIALWTIPAVLGVSAREQQSPLTTMITLAAGIFALGWLGAERTFFRLRREGKEVALRELVDSVLGFIGRFFKLGVLVGVAVFPAIAVGMLVGTRYAKEGNVELGAVVIYVSTLAVMLVLDVALTFVTPALTFTTPSAREALRIGLRMIRQTWPRSGLYILCPPLALNLLNAMYRNQRPQVTMVTTAAFAILSLVAKGATAVFYLRERPIAAPDAAPPASAAPPRAGVE